MPHAPYALSPREQEPMTYQLSFRQTPAYLHARVTGVNTAQTVAGYLRAVTAECQRLKCARVLIEEHLTGPGLSMGQVFEIVSAGTRQIPVGIAAIAFVDTNPEHSPRTMSFAEDVAVNRGMNVRMFANLAEASAWLEAADTLEPPSA